MAKPGDAKGTFRGCTFDVGLKKRQDKVQVLVKGTPE